MMATFKKTYLLSFKLKKGVFLQQFIGNLVALISKDAFVEDLVA